MNMLNNSRYSQPKSLQGCAALQAMLTGNAHCLAVTTSKHTQADITIDIMNNIHDVYEYNSYVVGRVTVDGTASLQQGPRPQGAWPGLSFWICMYSWMYVRHLESATPSAAAILSTHQRYNLTGFHHQQFVKLSVILYQQQAMLIEVWAQKHFTYAHNIRYVMLKM